MLSLFPACHLQNIRYATRLFLFHQIKSQYQYRPFPNGKESHVSSHYMGRTYPRHNSNDNYLFPFSVQTQDISEKLSDLFPFESSANQIEPHNHLLFSKTPLSHPHPNVKFHLLPFPLDIPEYWKGNTINGIPEKEDVTWLYTLTELF